MGMLWRTTFNIDPFMPEFPNPGTIAGQIIEDASYYFEGKDRGQSDWHLFEYTLEGEGEFWDANGRYRLPPGKGFLCKINDPATGYRYIPGNRDPWKIFFFNFHAENALIRKMLKRSGPIFQVPLDSPVILSLLEYEKQDGSSIEISPGEGMAIVNTLLSALIDTQAEITSDTAASWLVQEIRRYVRSNLNKNLHVSECAKSLKVTSEHLCRTFKQETGMTPFSYITRERIRRACDLLHDQSMSIKEICGELDFDNSSHFARTFRKVTGMTPSEYRKKGGVPLI